jgi:hypothetical protein
MGYELHIVRRNDYDDLDEQSNISLDEWLAYVESDKELELTNGYQIKVPGVTDTFQNVPGFCNWTAHSTKKRDELPWFDYGYGSITAKYPDDETIRKMIEIAEKLNAKVQGDDSEFYDLNYFQNKEGEGPSGEVESSVNKKPWWKFW